MMSNPLIQAIREVMISSPEFRSIAEKSPTVFGTITHYNDQTGKANITYKDPVNNFDVIKSNIDVTRFRGVYNRINVGDFVVICFPYGDSNRPIVLNVIPPDGEKVRMPGYMSTSVSQGW